MQLTLKKKWCSHEKGKPILIAGPCSAESEEQALETAAQLARIGCKIFRAGVWKPRTKPGGFEGNGEMALSWLELVKKETGLLVATEVATPRHVEQALKHNVDLFWIGARTISNPFAVQELSEALKSVDIPVLVKNPVCPDLELWIGALERLNKAGVNSLAAVHRGFSVYGDSTYRNAPIWNIPIELHRLIPDLPIICDPSHMGGRRDLILQISQQAMDLCYDGLMIESHCNPNAAMTDMKQQITPASLGNIMAKLNIRSGESVEKGLSEYRMQINELDESVVRALAKRMEVCHRVARYKAEHGLTALQSKRYEELLDKWNSWSYAYGLPHNFTQHLFSLIHEESVKEQIEILNTNKNKWQTQQ